MAQNLIFEIGTEEIPSGALYKATEQLAQLAQAALDEAGLAHGAVETCSTPRRMILSVAQLAEATEALELKAKGPAAKIAFDADGAPTKAATGFARGKGIEPEQLVVEADENGVDYVYALVSKPSVPAAELLPGILQGLVKGLSWPRSQRWGSGHDTFSRPVRWLVALLGEQVVPVEFAGLTAGRTTYGHRFLAPQPVEVACADEFFSKFEQMKVIPSAADRAASIRAQIKAVEEQTGLVADTPQGTFDEVVNLVEWPTVIVAHFDEEFLDVPPEIITDAMLEHQRYFPLYRKDGSLDNAFIVTGNGDPACTDTIRDGNERVVRARLDDAKFFFEEDKKHHLVDYTEKLKKIVFQDGLGTLFDKAQRLEKITVFLNQKLDLGLDDAKLQRASLLAKADLATQMVMEFTELQGVMGKEYALIDGEDEGVAEAINEQYQPRFAGDVLPQTDMGKVLGIADKFDTITGMFSQGYIPTGSQDPFALRRQTIGILNILMDAGWNLNCHEVFAFVLNLLGVEGEKAAKVMDQLDDYFTLRLKNIFQDKGMDYHIIDCVLASDTLNAYEEARRAQALIDADIMGKTDLLQAFTRVGNMIKDAEDTDVNPDLFETEEEKALYSACQAMQVNLPQKYAVYDYQGVADVLSEGIAAINDFLDNVLVMHKDEAVKENRLHLLTLTYSLIQPLGDIKKLS